MGIQVICSEPIYLIIKEYIAQNLCTVEEDSDICFVEKGFPIPDKPLVILFEREKVNELNNIIQAINKDSVKSIEFLVGKNNGKYEILRISEIEKFESFDTKVFAICNGESYQIKNKLYELEERLLEFGFIRINKSVIINIRTIDEFMPWFSGKLLLKMKDGSELEVTKSYAQEFKKYIGM